MKHKTKTLIVLSSLSLLVGCEATKMGGGRGTPKAVVSVGEKNTKTKDMIDAAGGCTGGVVELDIVNNTAGVGNAQIAYYPRGKALITADSFDQSDASAMDSLQMLGFDKGTEEHKNAKIGNIPYDDSKARLDFQMYSSPGQGTYSNDYVGDSCGDITSQTNDDYDLEPISSLVSGASTLTLRMVPHPRNPKIYAGNFNQSDGSSAARAVATSARANTSSEAASMGVGSYHRVVFEAFRDPENCAVLAVPQDVATKKFDSKFSAKQGDELKIEINPAGGDLPSNVKGSYLSYDIHVPIEEHKAGEAPLKNLGHAFETVPDDGTNVIVAKTDKLKAGDFIVEVARRHMIPLSDNTCVLLSSVATGRLKLAEGEK